MDRDLIPNRMSPGSEPAPRSKWSSKQDLLEVALAGLRDLIPDDGEAFRADEETAAGSAAPEERNGPSRAEMASRRRASLWLGVAAIACVGFGSGSAYSMLSQPYGVAAAELGAVVAGAPAIMVLAAMGVLARRRR